MPAEEKFVLTKEVSKYEQLTVQRKTCVISQCSSSAIVRLGQVRVFVQCAVLRIAYFCE